ncbi:hypothetical protein SDC9_205447 [bioreactor metagenome]|uniref:Uncharacterized protein n=1 Tax=bioreactor metagenome TaxID=1076179 RepID=A0A645JDW9_9ZZZZ
MCCQHRAAGNHALQVQEIAQTDKQQQKQAEAQCMELKWKERCRAQNNHQSKCRDALACCFKRCSARILNSQQGCDARDCAVFETENSGQEDGKRGAGSHLRHADQVNLSFCDGAYLPHDNAPFVSILMIRYRVSRIFTIYAKIRHKNHPKRLISLDVQGACA